MGDAKNDDLRVGLDRRLKLRFCGSKVTSDARLLAYRELDEVLGLTKMGSDLLTDFRQGSNRQHLLGPLLRQSTCSRLAGYEDVNDVERLDQEGSAYNGHFACTCCHPLFLFNQFGDLEYAMLRRGNKAGAKYWRRRLFAMILNRIASLAIPPPAEFSGNG